ncbi:MAG: pyridoxal-phosphate dependent enzyme, partial [Maricaulaceae bacterium]
ERTTAREIVEAFEGQSLDYFVTGYGTGGTLTGVGRVLRKESPKTKIIACEPDVAALISSGTPQARRDDGAPAESHPAFHPHPMQGWTPDFIPKITSEAIDGKYFDEMVLINGADAIAASKALAQQEGIFVGITSGATLAGALKTSESAPKGSNVLCMLPDTGERYLSTPLFEGVEADMNDEENEISRSTPTAQFTSASATPKPSGDATAKAEKAAPPVDGDAKAFLDRTINDRSQPVVMFALEWCEFCWAARKLFSALGVDYRSVDLDSVAYQADDLGNRIRAALKAKTGVATIPQIFVGGEFVGGCSELLEAKASGQLSELLTKAGASFDPGNEVDPFDLLPKWVHPRTTEASTGAEQKPH